MSSYSIAFVVEKKVSLPTVLESPEEEDLFSVSTSPRPSIGDIAELSTDESAPDGAEHGKGIDYTSEPTQLPQEQHQQNPTNTGDAKGGLNSLIQALVDLKMNETTVRPRLPPGLEDLEPMPPQPRRPPGFENSLPHQAPLTFVVEEPQPSQKTKQKNKQKSRKATKADPVSDSGMQAQAQAQALAFQKAMDSQQAIYYQQWQAMQAAQVAYAGQLARYQHIAAAAQVAQMQRASAMQQGAVAASHQHGKRL